MLTDEKKYGKMKTDKRLPVGELSKFYIWITAPMSKRPKSVIWLTLTTRERLPKCFSLVNRQLLDERAVYFFIATTNNKIIVR